MEVGISSTTTKDFSLYENLTNDAEAILKARLLKCKSPSDDPPDERQWLKREAHDRWDGADGHIRSAIVNHHIRVKIVTGEVHRHRRVSHEHPAAHFTIHPLRDPCERWFRSHYDRGFSQDSTQYQICLMYNSNKNVL